MFVHASYRQTFSNNLSAQDWRVRVAPRFELSFDLNGNLKTRNKVSNSYSDARELADGDIKQLTLIQVDNAQIIDGIKRTIQLISEMPKEWYLTIHLEGERHFRVRPELTGEGEAQSLFLYVVAEE